MALKFVLKLEKEDKPDPNQTEMEGVGKQKPHKVTKPVGQVATLQAAMRFASQILVDMYSKDKHIVLIKKENGEEIEMDRYKCSMPLGHLDSSERESE